MDARAESVLAVAVALLALSVLPLIASSLVVLFQRGVEPVQAIISSAVVLGCLGMCGLVWGQRLGWAQGWLVLLFSLVLLKVGLGLAVVFTWRAFRPHARQAAWLAFALITLLGFSLALDLTTVRTDASYPDQTVSFRFGQLITSIPFLWLGIESALVRRRLLLRPSPDESERLTATRLRLWSVACVALFLECQMALAASVWLLAPLHDSLVVARGLLYGLVALCVCLTFYVPRMKASDLSRLV